MIYTNSTITIENEKAYVDKKIVLYRGDKNVQVRFQIVENPYANQVITKTVNVLDDGSFAQLVIAREADPIFGEVAEVIGGEVLLTMTGEMIDGLEELGNYDFQIRLYNEDKTSRVTLPPVVAGIIVKEPIAMEIPKENANVNEAMINLAEIEEQAEDIETFVDGKYNKTVWADKDIITDVKLNKIENAIDVTYEKAKEVEEHTHNYAEIEHEHEEYALVEHEHEEYAKEVHKHEEYLTEHQSLEDYALKSEIPSIEGLATESYVKNQIANAQLGGEDTEIDLSGYATKDELNAKADKEHTHKEYLTEHQDLSAYAKKEDIKEYDDTEVRGLIANKADKEHTHEEYLTEVPSEFVTEEELNAKGYLTQHQSLEGLATEDYVNELLVDKADKEHEHTQYLTEHQDISHLATKEELPSLSNYATKDEIPTKVSELENDKGYLTEHQDLSEYAKKEELAVVEVANNVLTLSTNKYQYANITADTTITLPNVAEFTEIHLYFNIADNFAITLNGGSQIRYQAELVFEANNAYEVICTYVPNMSWLVGAVKYEGAVSEVGSGDVGTPDVVEPF